MKKVTDIVFVIDRSGSMSCIERETIDGYNQFLLKQRKGKGDVFVTTVLFDDQYDLLYSRKRIEEVENLSEKEYYARGSTALMDAIGKTIVKMKKELPNESRVLFVIMTDGLENASIEYNRNMVRKLIEKQKKWEFVFLGANIDSFEEGMSIGISNKSIANFRQNRKSVSQVFECASKLCDCEDVNLQKEISS